MSMDLGDHAAPQGSILGGLLFIINENDFQPAENMVIQCFLLMMILTVLVMKIQQSCKN